MKIKFIILLFCLPIIGMSQNITDSLLLYYPMDGNANDLSGNNFHGTPSGVTSVPNRYGVPNSAYYFDGVNDYIDFPLNDTLKPQFPMTFAFWAKISNPSIAKGEFFNLDFTQNNQSGVYMNVDAQGSIGLAIGGGLGSYGPQNRITFRTNEVMVDSNIWYHITGVIHSLSSMDIYINCDDANALYHSGTAPSIGYSLNNSGTLGRKDALINGSPYYFLGYLDEFSFWKRALNSAEVYTLCDSLPLMTPVPSWNCIANSCVDPGNGSGIYTALSSCQASCGHTAVNELNAERKLLRIVDVLGRNAKKESNVPLFYFYNDGTVEKQIIIE